MKLLSSSILFPPVGARAIAVELPISLVQPGMEANDWWDTLPSRSLTAPPNLAQSAMVSASGAEPGFPATNVIDGVIGNTSAWLDLSSGQRSLTLTWKQDQDVGCVVVILGREKHGKWETASSSLAVEYLSANDEWDGVTGATREDNEQSGVRFELTPPLRTRALRFVFSGAVEPVQEIMVYSPPGAAAPRTGLEPPAAPLVFVNQVGYDPVDPKRFTAPLAPDGARFVLRPQTGGAPLIEGMVRGGIGDFTAVTSAVSGVDYIIDVDGSGSSDPFRIEPFALERSALEPALRFWIDSRSVVGNHRTAVGGGAWRDGPYYNYDVPSLVLLYMANPSYFDQVPVEMNHAADKERVLDAGFQLMSHAMSDGALEATRRYYEHYEGPLDPHSPDILQLIHWGAGYFLEHPWNFDFAADPAGGGIHPQTVEKFAFFLYAYPDFKDRIDHAFYAQVLRFTLDHWEARGLFNVFKEIGTFKGRDCPGHSVLPNLLMHEVARREGHSDAGRFLDAAVQQVEWIVNELDLRDPRTTKGQRMSEHQLITGLWALSTLHPQRVPAGLRNKVAEWTDIMISRSDNLWDFRKFDTKQWTLPRYQIVDGINHGGAGWNEPGNIAGFTGIALAAADMLIGDPRVARLRQIGFAQMDNVFGRNPLGAHSAYRGALDFPGVTRGFPSKFEDFACARLDYVRGTLNSSAAHEQYPFNPTGPYRHVEGWTAFNAAFNVSLAFLCREHTRLSATTKQGEIEITLDAPVFAKRARVCATFADGSIETVPLFANSASQTRFVGRVPSRGAERVTLSYGFGLLAKQAIAAP